MSIKTKDIIPGTVVITSMPVRELVDDDHLLVYGALGSGFEHGEFLPIGTPLTIMTEPQHAKGITAKAVELETFAGQRRITFLSHFKPRVTIADHDA